jgi:hypothetical protein
MTVAIEGIFPLRIDVPASASVAAPAATPSRREARTAAKAEKLAAKNQADDIPARIRPDRAVFVKPVLFGLLAVAAIGGGISLWSFIDTVQHFVVGGIAGLLVGAGLWTITELAVIMVTLLIAMLNARGQKLLVVILGWAFITLTALVPVFMNFIHAVVLIRPGQDVTPMVEDIDPAIQPLLVGLLHIGQWVLVGALSAVPLIVLAIIAFIEVALVRRPEGTRKQRLRAVAKREAASDAVAAVEVVAEPVAVVAAPKPRAAVEAVTTRNRSKHVYDPNILKLAVETYRTVGDNNSAVMAVLATKEEGEERDVIGRDLFQKLYKADARREAGLA